MNGHFRGAKEVKTGTRISQVRVPGMTESDTSSSEVMDALLLGLFVVVLVSDGQHHVVLAC